ncbi:histidine kinase [Fulvivirgaceae bacterium BMA10]|uniref:Histidine kinase n=1 Tax=Splendidivirga corallicola TaxID=3051826 RepID=A0ABT8KYE0_9BACT|nr:histidine kinase [Fulvivirgaceae bacterium BMA10]
MRITWVKFVVAPFVGLLLYSYLFFSQTGEFPNYFTELNWILLVIIVSLVIGVLLSLMSNLLNRVISWHSKISLRFLTQLVASIIIIGLISIGSTLIYMRIDGSYENLEFFWELYKDLGIKFMLLGFVVIVIYNIADFTFHSYNQYAIGQIQKVQLERKQLELQFEALKGQISPHYLFNCFNTISSLVYKDAKDAEIFIRRLVQTYQYILNTKNQKLIDLHREIEFVKAYNYLLKVRFEEAFQIKIDVPEHAMKTKLPPLTLQMLVENAVKHNVISDEHPLEVIICFNKANKLIVSNNKTPKMIQPDSHKVGLNNIRKRYGFFTNNVINVRDDKRFEVILPILDDVNLAIT